MSRRLRESEGRVRITSIEQVYELAELGYGDSIYLSRFGKTCNLVSFNPKDAKGNYEDLREYTGESGSGEDIFVFNQEIGQSGCNWFVSYRFKEEINEGFVVVDGKVPDDVLVEVGILSGGIKDKVYSFSFDFEITDDTDLEDVREARYELLRIITNIPWIKVVDSFKDNTEWTKKEYSLLESIFSRRNRNR